MVYYIPCNFTYLSDILNLFYKHTNKQSSYEQEQVFLDLIDNNVCKYINKKGVNKNKFCFKNNNDNNFCKRHNINKQFQPLCNGITKYGKECKQKSKFNSNYCHYHEIKNIKNNTVVYKCIIDKFQIFLLENPNVHNYKSEIVKKQYNIFDIIYFMNKYNLLYIDLLYLLNIFFNLPSQKSKKMENGWDCDCNKQLILYKNKEIQKVTFSKKIYDYIDKFKYENFIKKLKKYDFSKIYKNINYNEIQKNKKSLKNRKKKMKKRDKYKPNFEISYKYIDTKYIEKQNFEHIFSEELFGLKIFPFEYIINKNNIKYKILYFHCFINKDAKDTPKVNLFYNEKDKLKHIIIKYKELYDILINIYNKKSVLEFIKKYYKKFNP
jgi:hypothetical protein